MKRIITSILSLAFLSGLFVNTSFAEEIHPTATAQRSASSGLNSENQQKPSIAVSDSVINETKYTETSNQPGLNKNNSNKKTGREKDIALLKNYMRIYNENQQKLIQKYENMTDKEIRWDKIKKFLKKAFVSCGTVAAIVGAYIGTYLHGLKNGFEDGYNSIWTWPKGFGYKKGEDRQKYKGRKNGFNQGYADGFAETYKCSRVLTDTLYLTSTLLTALQPDSFTKTGKTFKDFKELYYNATNFYDTYSK